MRKIPARIAFSTALVAVAYLAVQPAAAEEIVYVPLGGAGEVLVIDAESDSIRGRIAGVPQSHGLAATPDGRLLIAGSFAEVAPEAAKLPPKPAGVSESDHQAHHRKPDHAAAAKDEGVSLLTVLQAEDGKILRRIEVPGAVHHTAVTPDGRYALATHPNGGTLSVVDLATFQIAATVRTGPLPNYAVASPDGTRIYVSNAGNNTVSEVDTERWVVHRNFPTGESPEHMVLSRDGARLYVANVDAGTVSELAVEVGTVTRTFEIGGLLHGLDLSEDGGTLFVAARERNKLVAIALDSGDLRDAPLSPEPYHLTTVGGTGKIYVSSAEEPKIWVIDQDSLSVLNTVPVPSKAHQMAVVKR
jgi:YVTN family beta-propeller protein